MVAVDDGGRAVNQGRRMTHGNDQFLARRQRAVQTSAGPMDFPILYRDIGGMSAFFHVDAARVARELADTGLSVVPPFGRTIVGVAFFTYRDCTIASYDEAAVAVIARPQGQAGESTLSSFMETLRTSPRGNIASHILQLPVTTEQARAGGVEVYGYPKFVADISLHFDGNRFRGVVREKETGEEIVRLDGRARLGVTVKAPDTVTWSLLGDQLLCTHIEMDAKLRLSVGHGFRLHVGNSHHPMAQQLRALGLDGKRPFLVARSDSYRSVLPLGEPA